MHAVDKSAYINMNLLIASHARLLFTMTSQHDSNAVRKVFDLMPHEKIIKYMVYKWNLNKWEADEDEQNSECMRVCACVCAFVHL